jgi:pSer/pThr/pTyr-binding forkhead associated (FHA) protein
MAVDAVALYVGQNDQPVVVQITSQAVLGRYAAGSSSQPRIDLAPYNAFGKGVSRMHAVIRRTDRGLVIEDLASSNGSWLNGVRLPPFAPHLLQSGDRLALSQLEIVVRFQA